jgi:hypothetical protein
MDEHRINKMLKPDTNIIRVHHLIPLNGRLEPIGKCERSDWKQPVA